MSESRGGDGNRVRREQAEEHSKELRDRFMDLASSFAKLRQRFLIAIGVQPARDKERR